MVSNIQNKVLKIKEELDEFRKHLKNTSLTPIKSKSLITHYENILKNTDYLKFIANILLNQQTNDKSKYDELNKILLINNNNIAQQFIKDDRTFDLLKLIFNEPNILGSYLIYNFLVSYKFNQETHMTLYKILEKHFMKLNVSGKVSYSNMTTKIKLTHLYLTGDIITEGYNNMLFDDPLGVFVSNITHLYLDGNNKLNYLNLSFYCKNLQCINANNCNIFFIPSTIFDLVNLQEINLNNNPNLLFSVEKYQQNKMKYVQSHQQYIEDSIKNNYVFLYNDIKHPIISLLLPYLQDYIVPTNTPVPANTSVSNRNSTKKHSTNRKSTNRNSTKRNIVRSRTNSNN